MQKWNIANRINSNYDFASIIKELELVKRPDFIKLVKKKGAINKSPDMYKIAILDFEGSPVF